MDWRCAVEKSSTHFRFEKVDAMRRDVQRDDRWQNITDQMATGGASEGQGEFEIRDACRHESRKEHDECGEDHE